MIEFSWRIRGIHLSFTLLVKLYKHINLVKLWPRQVRLQLEALLAEKSRLAYENATLVRENQCLHQLVEYHQHTSQDLSASYEQFIQGMCLDFSSPSPPKRDADDKVPQTPQADLFSFSTTLEECDHQRQ